MHSVTIQISYESPEKFCLIAMTMLQIFLFNSGMDRKECNFEAESHSWLEFCSIR